MMIPVEDVQAGDRIEVWHEDAPRAVVVGDVAEDNTIRTFNVSYQGGGFELNIPRGYTVKLVC